MLFPHLGALLPSRRLFCSISSNTAPRLAVCAEKRERRPEGSYRAPEVHLRRASPQGGRLMQRRKMPPLDPRSPASGVSPTAPFWRVWRDSCAAVRVLRGRSQGVRARRGATYVPKGQLWSVLPAVPAGLAVPAVAGRRSPVAGRAVGTRYATDRPPRGEPRRDFSPRASMHPVVQGAGAEEAPAEGPH